MMHRTVNFVLLAAFVATLLLNWQVRPHPGRPNFEFLPGLVRTPRFNSYSENPNFSDGTTLRTPVTGTIPRGFAPLHFTSAPEDAARAAVELQNPVPAGDEQANSRGATVFSNFCQPCHGPDGSGNGPVVQRGFPGPPSLLAENARNMKDGQLFHIVTFGQKNMPSHASQIGREDRWNVIAHIRSLQTKQAGGQTPAPSVGPPSGGPQ
jgi:mono/diheme cytochrome c family protein